MTPEDSLELRNFKSNPLFWAIRFLKTAEGSPFKPNYLQEKSLSGFNTKLSPQIGMAHRGSGKSTALVIRGLHKAFSDSYKTIIVLASNPTKFHTLLEDYICNSSLDKHISNSTSKPFELRLENQSKILTKNLFSSYIQIRGFQADLLLIDEGDGISEYDWDCIRPTLLSKDFSHTRIAGEVLSLTSMYLPSPGFYEKLSRSSGGMWLPVSKNPDFTPQEVGHIRDSYTSIGTQKDFDREWMLIR